MQIPSQKIITKDNVSIDIAAVAYYHISDPEKAVIVIENVYNAINQISQAVEIKDIVLPDNMQRAMAKEAEAERVALQLRTLQTMAEISVERNSTIIFPAQFMTTVQEAIALLSKNNI